MISGFYSEEGFDELYKLATQIAMLTNPQLFFDLQDLPEIERRAKLQELLDEMEERIS